MEYEYWLASLPLLSDKKKYMLREYFGSGEALFYIEETKLKGIRFLNENETNTIIQAKRTSDPMQQFTELKKREIHFVPHFTKEFPGRLQVIPDPPYSLYVKGALPMEGQKAVAIVGARKCTPYGEKYAMEFGALLAKKQIAVISGLARGVDGFSHRGALMGEGMTYGVLGCGVDICYPREHIGLYMDILEQGGGVFSEFPPGTPPLPQNFPRRNRIISGLADVVLVMEAREKSGSLITADLALEQGKDVYALPGPINSSLSRGCNQLIAQGAGILCSPDMLLEEMGVLEERNEEKSNSMGRRKMDKNEKVLESLEKLVYAKLALFPKSLEQLMEETQLPAKELLGILGSLELKGYVREISKNHYIGV